MTWNYRVLKRHDNVVEEDLYYLIECYYEADGSLKGYHDDVGLIGNSTQELLDILEMMKQDILKDRPILAHEDFYKKDKKDDSV
jgi:hypothetical protein